MKRFILILLPCFYLYAYEQIPYEGSYLFGFSMGTGRQLGTLVENESEFIKNLGMVYMVRDINGKIDTIDFKYTFYDITGEFDISYFVKDRIFIGFSGSYGIENEISNYKNLDKQLCDLAKIGPKVGYWFTTLTSLSLSADLGVNYVFGNITRQPVLKSIYDQQDLFKDYIDALNNKIRTKGAGLNTRLKVIFFPFTGRFFFFASGRYDYSLLFIKDNYFVDYPSKLNFHKLGFLFGAGYLTE